jgi:AcrR family transcriptional regulator
VEQLVVEHGTVALTVPLIAKRAHVNATSIYRRWGDLAALMNDLATYRPTIVEAATGHASLRVDLMLWAKELVAFYRVPANATLLRCGVARAGEWRSDCLRGRYDEARKLLELHDAASEEPRVRDNVIAPIVYRAIFQPDTLNESTAAELIDAFW